MTYDLSSYVDDKYFLESQHVKGYKFIFSMTYELFHMHAHGLCIEKPLLKI